jgi:HK97 family phage major capsid protein
VTDVTNPLITQLDQRYKETWDAGRALLDRVEADKRDLTAEEDAQWRRMNDDLDTIRERISELRAQDARERASQATFDDLFGRPGATAHRSEADRGLDQQFRDVVRSNSRAPIDVSIPAHEMRSGFQPGLERRDLVTTSGGGLTPTSFWNQLQRHMVESSAILSAGATVIQTSSGETLKVPKSTAFSSAAIIAEGGSITESDPTLGTAPLGAYKYGFSVQVSHEIVEDASFDLLGFLAEQAGVAVGNAFGAHAITGTGTGQPSGIVTGATTGVTGPTGTATSFGVQTTAGQGADLLLDLYGSLAEPYARSAAAAWLMRNATFTAIRKLRDSTGNYIVTSDVPTGSGAAGMLLGRPVYLDPNVAAMAAGAKSVIFGDISKYWVRQVNGIRFERSDDFAFQNDLITFRCLARLDGTLVDTTGAVKYFVHSAT